jgi:TonB family protein
MKTFCIIITIAGCILFISPSITLAQDDSAQFKFIPPYYPDGKPINIKFPSIYFVHIPKIIYPNDPKLQGKEARVLVKILVDREGNVCDTEILNTPDEAFNKYAIKYAKQYKFRWYDKWPEELKNKKGIWCSIAINFKRDS